MFNASIVLYKHTIEDVEKLVKVLNSSSRVNNVYLIDNSPIKNDCFSQLPVKYIFTGKNVGYGAANNIAIRKSIEQDIPYHLVVNPDIKFDAKVLDDSLDYMDKNPDVGHLMPKVLYPNGDIQYLCKLLPKPSDLIFRRFLPASWSVKSNAKFELRASGYDKIMEVPYLSGCFMLLRTEALKKVGLFDEGFFMYPEDIDLTRRIHQKYKTIFYPNVSIIHAHEQGSYRNGKLLFIHLWNLIKYFNKWGWIIDEERDRVNNETLKKLNLDC